MSLAVNTYTPKKPLEAICISNIALSQDFEEGETRHIVLEFLDADFSWKLGQSIGVLAPGLNHKNRAHIPRLYSIASPSQNNQRVELCVKRVVYKDSGGEEIRGVASNFLCDLKPQQPLKLSGPLGRHFIIEDLAEETEYFVFIATGTGIAPFRAFIQDLAKSKTPRPKVWLIMGVRDMAHLLYQNEFTELAQAHPEWFKFDYVLSREQTNAVGQRKYIGDFLMENQETFWELMQNPKAKTYLCGIKGMEDGIDRCMRFLENRKKFNWETLKKDWIKSKRWNKEVY
jgi:ferredoxin--NADP+ reductase